MNRIAAIDGWRALAALGVLWTHCWAATNLRSIEFAGIDIFKLINIVGNGVHLFFVISGFCMYLVLKKYNKIDIKIFLQFLKKRWIRIAPAFYFAALVIGTINLFSKGEELIPRLIYNFLFLQNQFSASTISAPFWSLAVEWHFYILLPLIWLIGKKSGFVKCFFLFGGLSVLMNLLHYSGSLLPNIGWWYLLPGNLIHFMWGILLANIIYQDRMPAWLENGYNIIPAFILANFGKMLFSKQAIKLAGKYDWLPLSIGPGIMTLGFSWLIYISLKNFRFGKIIGNSPLSALGRISYSFYLWHAFILEGIANFLNGRPGFKQLNAPLLFVITLIILIPVSYISYLIFEKFYFNKNHGKVISTASS